MLGKDLAAMYGVEVRSLNQAVKRNIERFPSDFMFQLSNDEWIGLKSQFVISSWGGVRKVSIRTNLTYSVDWFLKMPLKSREHMMCKHNQNN